MPIAKLRLSMKEFMELHRNGHIDDVATVVRCGLHEICKGEGTVHMSVEPSSDYFNYFVDSPHLPENSCLKLNKDGTIVVMTGIARAIDILRRMR